MEDMYSEKKIMLSEMKCTNIHYSSYGIYFDRRKYMLFLHKLKGVLVQV